MNSKAAAKAAAPKAAAARGAPASSSRPAAPAKGGGGGGGGEKKPGPVVKQDTKTAGAKPVDTIASSGTTKKPVVDAGSKPSEPATSAVDGSKEPAEAKTTPQQASATTEAAQVLRQRPFMIQCVRVISGDGTEKITGSMLSQSLDKALQAAKQPESSDVGRLTLAGLRKLKPPGMSSYTSIDKFCTDGGVRVDDEAISFTEYLALLGGKKEDPPTTSSPAPNSKIPTVNLYFCSAKGEAKATITPVEAPAIDLTRKEVTATRLTSTREKHENITAETAPEMKTGAGANPGAGTLSEDQWALVLRNCAVFYGWAIDPRSHRIVRAPKQAFQLRSRVDRQPITQIPDLVPRLPSPPPQPPAAASEPEPEPEPEPEGVFEGGPVEEALATMGASEFVNVSSPSSGSEKVPPTNSETAQIVSRETSEPSTAVAKQDGEGGQDKAEETKEKKKEEKQDEMKEESPAQAKETQVEQEQQEQEQPPPAFLLPKSTRGIPNFRVNDDSRIEVTAHESDLSVSMARSDFSESATQASASGGFGGFSASVSGGKSSGSASNAAFMASVSSKTLVARYMFPRCDLILWPDELEPTPELAALIDTIARTKDINALRRLQVEYGQLFCQNITLGGRLMSTKAIATSETKMLAEQKESFKSAIGASVSGSYGGFSGSASASHEKGSGKAVSTEAGAGSQSESLAFEAVGGDTLLANSAPAWAPTVGRYDLWRVINVCLLLLFILILSFTNATKREGLAPLAQILSQMPGYEAVQSWFVQAIPKLSQYMTLDAGHECRARFRVLSPSNSLQFKNLSGDASFYLGHDYQSVTPRRGGVVASTGDQFWIRLDISANYPMFNPASYRAPAILGYKDYKVGKDNQYGAKYDPAYLYTEWTIIAPFEEELVHGTRIILRTNSKAPDPPPPPPAATATVATKDAAPTTAAPANGVVVAAAPPPPPPPAPAFDPRPRSTHHMVVFRNAQGEFLPGLSDADEYQYWRIMKTDPSEPHIKPGDEIRLAWDFRDQTTGWRDFLHDVFGRRQVAPPPDQTEPLLLKVPWPRFDDWEQPTALIMSSLTGEQPSKPVTVVNKDKAPETYMYCMQDLKLRIDAVGNDGFGDTGDYMLSNVEQEGAQFTASLTVKGGPLAMKEQVFWFGIK